MHGVAGLLVGAIVGITGVGGGALMTPILVMLFGVAPTTAVGTDLLYASVTKMFGTAVHRKAGTVDWQIVRRLAMGSLPAAALTLAGMHFAHVAQVRSGVITFTLGIALVVTALGILFKEQIHSLGTRFRLGDSGASRRCSRRCRGLRRAARRDGDAHVGGRRRARHGDAGSFIRCGCRPASWWAPTSRRDPVDAIAGMGHLALGNVDLG